MKKRILITGNLGYIGPVVVRHLRSVMPEVTLIGFDSAFFAHCTSERAAVVERLLDMQVFGDIRDLPPDLLGGVDAVIHLAAVSNDPMGNRFEAVTDEINHRASVRLAEIARSQGVKQFVFASSCSVYGAADGPARREGDPLNPLTAYARSKIDAERGLRGANCSGIVTTCLRFATACGFSPRLRLDLVLNDFVAGALAEGRITVLSDGTPWRPLIDVSDMARAIEWAVTRDESLGGQFLAVNVGSDDWNYQVRDLAYAVAEAIPGTSLSINTEAPPDRRSYRVDFSLFRTLAPAHQPRVTLADSINSVRDGLRRIDFADREFRNSNFIRLKVLERLIDAGVLNGDLRWRDPTGVV